jgi:secreted PhoX family phosphatase
MFEVQRPFAATAAAAGVRWLSRIPAVSQEGIRFDKSLNLYFIDESNTGSIYKFVPLVPGNLAVGQSFVLRVTAYTGNATLNWDNALASPRVGPATWVPITDVVGNRITVADPFQYNSSISLGGRSAADEVGGTPYGRPEDIALSVDKDGNEVLYVPTTTENVVYTIVLLDATNAFVKTLCSRNTIDISTGLPVGSNFTSPDNMAIDAAGTVYVVEDQGPPVADIWQAVDVDNDGVAEYLARWLGMGVAGAEPTGLFFHPNNLDTAIVAVQHPSSVNDAVWEIKLGACAVTYRVWNARTQQAVATLVDGLVIAQPPCLVNIQAVATCGSAQTPITPPVVIRLATRAGVVVRTRTETLAPYFLFGDTGGRILDGAISAGTYRISSTVGGVATPSVLFTFGTCGPN